MTTETTTLPGVLRLIPEVHADDRGFFMEAFSVDALARAGVAFVVVQHNQSHSRAGVIRGIHFQWNPSLAKLVRVVHGRVYAVMVDLRSASPTKGKWYATELSGENKTMLSVPVGVGFGFCALEDDTDVEYYYDAPYGADGESVIAWNDPDLAISWPVTEPILSERDRTAGSLKEWFARPEASLF